MRTSLLAFPPRLPIALLALLVVPAIGCSPKGDPAAAAQGPAAVPVSVAKAEVRTTPVRIQAIGTVEAFSTVSVRPRVSGVLDEVRFKEGDDVKAGDVLFKIDQAPYKVALDQAAAQLAKDRVLAKNAQTELDRYQKLLGRGLVNRSEFDKVNADAQAAKATLQVDQARVEDARLQLSWCTIVAPVSGRTGRLLVHGGNLVTSGESQALVTINQLEPVSVSFSAPESSLDEIRRHFGKGAPRKVEVITGDGGATHEGELTFIDNGVDTTTGTVLLKATFPNHDRALWPGQFVNVTLNLTERPNSVVVPDPAVQTGQEGDFVFVVRPDQTVESRKVVVGTHLGDAVVIDSGLKGGETVVTDGQLRLTPGAKIEVKPAVGGAEQGGGEQS